MPATKVIPGSPATEEEIAAFLGPAAQAPELATYLRFLRRYGGGHVFPNTILATEPINPEFRDAAWSVQSFRTPGVNLAKHAAALRLGHWDDSHRPVGVISGGDSLLISLIPPTRGQVFYWTPDDDGMSYRIVRVADSFDHLLAQMTFLEEQGATPPWNRMNSVDDAPAIDLDLDPAEAAN